MAEAIPQAVARSRMPRVAMALGFGLGIPAVLQLALNYLRPDVMTPYLRDGHGLVILTVAFAIAAIGAGLYVLVVLEVPGTRFKRIVVAVVGALLFTMPALFIILFGPIVSVMLRG